MSSAALAVPDASATERREARREAKAHVARLRGALEDAKRRHKSALFEARERCRAERLAVRERTRAMRIRVLAELRETAKVERQAAHDACKLRLREARTLKGDEAQARAAFAAERKFQNDLRASEHAHQARKKSADAMCGCAPKSDAEMVAALPSDLARVYERVRHELPKQTSSSATARAPKTPQIESFLEWVEKHPVKFLEATHHPAHVEVKSLEAQHAEAKKALNPYEQKKAARVERMKARAERLAQKAQASHAQAHRIASVIPMGQPILVGHHSERRHRRDIARIDHGYKRSFELQKQYEHLERRAKYAEQNRAISSDDPDAVPKLRAKLAELNASRVRMVNANKAVRSKDPKAGLSKLGFSDSQIQNLLTPDPMGRVGFPSYALTNTAHEVARIKKRIEVLSARATAPTKPAVVGAGVRIEEAENRVRIIFDAKPPVEMRTALKGAGFRWAPSVGAWQRHASAFAWDDAKRITKAGTPSDTAPSVSIAASRVRSPEPVRNVVRSPANTNVLRGTTKNTAEDERLRTLTKKHAAQPKPKGDERPDTTQIAALIRADIKDAVKRGKLPKAKYSVVTDKYSMGSSITVTASKLPFPVLNPDSFVVLGDANYTQRDSRYKSNLTDRAEAVQAKLEEIVNAYHWDKSDPMSDVYNERFARSVKVESAPGEYAAIEKAKLKEVRERRGY